MALADGRVGLAAPVARLVLAGRRVVGRRWQDTGHAQTVAAIVAKVARLDLGGALAARVERIQVGILATVAPVGSWLVDADGALVAIVQVDIGALVQIVHLLDVGQKQCVRVGQGLGGLVLAMGGPRRVGARFWRRRVRLLARGGRGRQRGRLAHVKLLG